jgi:hypothetical protein
MKERNFTVCEIIKMKSEWDREDTSFIPVDETLRMTANMREERIQCKAFSQSEKGRREREGEREREREVECGKGTPDLLFFSPSRIS